MRILYRLMVGAALVLLVGTVGSIDHDTITLGEALIQVGAGFVLGAVGEYGIKLEKRRGR